ncbi:response regulator [Methylobacterium sp. D54C]
MTPFPSNAPPYALVVDDDSMIRMDAVDILEEAGFTTFEAASGDKALIVLEQHHACVTLLFTDVQMPGEHDGFALSSDIRN